ncbi:hypothetical protein ACOMHN_056865 [Nucella lapillus]
MVVCSVCVQVPQLAFVSLLFVFIVVGNCCVLAAIQLSDNGRKTRMNFFITHLAIAGKRVVGNVLWGTCSGKRVVGNMLWETC